LPTSDRIPLDIIARNPTLELTALPSALFRDYAFVPDGSLYTGFVAMLLVLVAVVAGRRGVTFPWALLTLLCGVRAVGPATLMLSLVYTLVPMSDKVREPVRYLLLAHIGVSVLVAFGINSIQTRTRRSLGIGLGERRIRIRAPFVALLCV